MSTEDQINIHILMPCTLFISWVVISDIIGMLCVDDQMGFVDGQITARSGTMQKRHPLINEFPWVISGILDRRNMP